MFIKTAKTADSILMNLAGLALDPKVIGYAIRYPSKGKKKEQYKFVKISNLQNKRTPEKAKPGVIQTPTRTPFNPTEVVAQAIQKTQSVPKTFNPDVANPKPTYEGISSGKMVQVDKSFNAPFKKVVGIFNINRKY